MKLENAQTTPDEQKHVHTHTLKRQIIVSISILLFLLLGTTLAVLYGKGYRFFVKKGEPQISKTGILRVTSLPPGAQVYVNDHLTTATDNSINLPPDRYKIKIAKDGYQDWQKDFEIQREVVQNADATLYPKAPTLQSISTLGIESVVPDPSGTKLAFKIASNSAKRNGIYIFDMTARSFPVLAGQSSSTQLADDTVDVFSQSEISWSPDGKQLLASISADQDKTTYYLLKTDGMNEAPQDVTATVTTLLDTWHIQRHDKSLARIKSLKPAVQKFHNKYFRVLAWSPDDEKILYQASESGKMDIFLNPRLIGNNQLYEQRTLQKGSIYVYNIKEDVNTRLVENLAELCTEAIPSCITPFTWFSDSQHLLHVHQNKIDIIEDDGSNRTTIYAGPFIGHYVFPWPDGSKLVIVTNLNNTIISPTLYSIGLK